MFKEHRLYARWSDGRNSVKINSSSIKTPHAHFQYVHIRYARFQKVPLKTFRVVDYTNSIPVKCDERTDRQTDGQTGANREPGTNLTVILSFTCKTSERRQKDTKALTDVKKLNK